MSAFSQVNPARGGRQNDSDWWLSTVQSVPAGALRAAPSVVLCHRLGALGHVDRWQVVVGAVEDFLIEDLFRERGVPLGLRDFGQVEPADLVVGRRVLG